jgi:hypothetical protein
MGMWTVTYFGIGNAPFTITIHGTSGGLLGFSGTAVDGKMGTTQGTFMTSGGSVTSLIVTNELPGGAVVATAAAFGGLALLSVFMSKRVSAKRSEASQD